MSQDPAWLQPGDRVRLSQNPTKQTKTKQESLEKEESMISRATIQMSSSNVNSNVHFLAKKYKAYKKGKGDPFRGKK